METNQFHNFFLNETTLPHMHKHIHTYVHMRIARYYVHGTSYITLNPIVRCSDSIELNFCLRIGIQSDWRKTDCAREAASSERIDDDWEML